MRARFFEIVIVDGTSKDGCIGEALHGGFELVRGDLWPCGGYGESAVEEFGDAGIGLQLNYIALSVGFIE